MHFSFSREIQIYDDEDEGQGEDLDLDLLRFHVCNIFLSSPFHPEHKLSLINSPSIDLYKFANDHNAGWLLCCWLCTSWGKGLVILQFEE